MWVTCAGRVCVPMRLGVGGTGCRHGEVLYEVMGVPQCEGVKQVPGQKYQAVAVGVD